MRACVRACVCVCACVSARVPWFFSLKMIYVCLEFFVVFGGCGEGGACASMRAHARVRACVRACAVVDVVFRY